MAERTVREYLAENPALLFDGAMGTYFAAHRTGYSRCELANLERPDEIAAIHRAYLEAGCRAIRTNTFDVGSDFAGGDPALGDTIIRLGCAPAMEAAEGYGAFVFADLGPAPEGGVLTPGENYRAQAEVYLSMGVTNFIVETLPTADGLRELGEFLKGACPDTFLLTSFAVGPDGRTNAGLDGRELLCYAAALPEVDGVGFNCTCGPRHMLELVRTLPSLGKPLSVMPNAGYPTVLGRRAVYQGKADYFARHLAQIAQAGAVILGGCCGTTPEHIRQAALELQKPRPVCVSRVSAQPKTPSRNEAVPSPFWDKLAAGERAIAVELDPPADADAAGWLAGVRTLEEAGADAVTIADCPVGRPRADSSLLACRLRREGGIEPLPHMTCRDRNLNATKALLLGLAMEGVRNVLLVTGDPVPAADRDEVKSVFNFNSRKLIRFVNSLNAELPAPFHIFAALNLNARNFDVQLRLAEEKEEAGAAGFLTQPVHSKKALENLRRAREMLSGKILGGVFPVVSHRNAVFLNSEVPGVHVCEELTALYEGKSREEAEEIAVRSSVRIAEEITPYTDGLYLMTPFKRTALMTRIMAQIISQQK